MNYGEVASLAVLAAAVMTLTLDVAVKGDADGYVFYTYFLSLVHVALLTVASLRLVPRIKARPGLPPDTHTLALMVLSILCMAAGAISALVWSYDSALDSTRIVTSLVVATNLLGAGFCYLGWAVNWHDRHRPLPQDDPEAETQRVLAPVDGQMPSNE